MKTNNSYPKFVHDRIDNHPILGQIKVYNIGKYPPIIDSGCQSNFFSNNAEMENENQFGIKMFNTSIEAFAAYQRQSLAAREGLSPPVGMMVRWITKNHKGRTVNRWGYETCIADVSCYARMNAQIRGCPTMSKVYADWFNFRNGGNPRVRFFSKKNVTAFFEYISNYDEYDGEIDAYSSMSSSVGEGSLRSRLMDISLVGTQYDNLAEVFDLGEMWNDRLRLGQTVIEDDDMYMSNDLHRGNLGLWKGMPVVIDFGYHIACPQYRDYDNLTQDKAVA